MFTYPFTPDLNLTTPRRTLERLFANSDPRCTFLPKHISKHISMYMLRLFNTNFMCLALISRNVAALKKRKTHLMGTNRKLWEPSVILIAKLKIKKKI